MQPAIQRPQSLHRLKLPENLRRMWTEDVARLSYPDPSDAAAWRAFADTSVALAKRHLAPAIASAVCRFFSGDGPDVLLIENLPLDADLPPPPVDGKRPAGKTAVSEAVIAGLIESYGAIVSYTNEKRGAPIHEIAPVAGQEHVPSSMGRVSFACHTDVAFLAPDFCPRGLLLFGLRNQSLAPTAVLPLDRILEAASPALLRALKSPIFRHPAPSSFDLPVSTVAPVLWDDERGITRIAVQTHAVQPVNDEAHAAILQLRGMLDSVEAERLILAPGVALLLRNDRVLHGRDAFTGERWLQRAYFTSSLTPFRGRTGSPAPAFAFDARLLIRKPSGLEKPLASSKSIGHSKN